MSPKNIEKNELSPEANRKLHKLIASKLHKYPQLLEKKAKQQGA